MNDIKEKVIVASCLMDENETNQLWKLILNNFPNYSWEHLEKIIFHSYDACALYALQVLQAACLDNRKCWEYLSREKTIRDYNQRMFEARESGRQEGEKAGIEKNQRDTARKMIAIGLPADTIAQVTGLSIAQIETL